MTQDLIRNSLQIAEWYRDLSLAADDYLKIKDSINRPCRQYILGRECERICTQYSSDEVPRRRLIRYASAIGYSESMMRMFRNYAKAIDRLRITAPEVVDMAFSGESRLTSEPIILMGKMNRGEIDAVLIKLTDTTLNLNKIFPNYARRSCRKARFDEQNCKSTKSISVKNMPKHDPDAEVSALTLTIPSWIGTINRTFDNTDFRRVTKSARRELLKELKSLINTADTLSAIITEVY